MYTIWDVFIQYLGMLDIFRDGHQRYVSWYVRRQHCNFNFCPWSAITTISSCLPLLDVA